MDSKQDTPLDPLILKPTKFQFKLKTLLICTTAIAIFFALVTQFEIGPAIFFFCIVGLVCGSPFVTASFTLCYCFCDEIDAICFSWPLRAANVLLVSVQSVAMLMLATVAFVPDWQGAKGNHWFYYLNDGPAGWSTLPIFVAGAVSYGWSVLQPRYALRSPANFAFIATNAAICWWYTLATGVFHFAQDASILAFVPLVAALNYTCYCVLLLRHVAVHWYPWDFKSLPLAGWFLCVATSIWFKIQLAQEYYASLPPNPPPGCFVVTAASRGHRWLVGSFHDIALGRTINMQLCVFWDFEEWLQAYLPGFHRRLRSVYNRVGPIVARTIYWRWQADLVFLLLLPLEFALRCAGFGRKQATRNV